MATIKCAQCGNEIVDPFCEEHCPQKLCQECGVKCFEDSIEECEECPYEPDVDSDEEDTTPEDPNPFEPEETSDDAEEPDW